MPGLPPICDLICAQTPSPEPPINRNLQDPHVNPDFRSALEDALRSARDAGFDPIIGETYRTPERSNWLKANGKTPAGEWESCHNYGLCVDILLKDKHGNFIRDNSNGDYKKFADHMKKQGFEWYGDYRKGDDGHFEYHPNWKGLSGGKFLKDMREIAKMEATAAGEPDNWLEYFWENAGAGLIQTHPLRVR